VGVLVLGTAAAAIFALVRPSAGSRPRLISVGPRLVSNETSQPLAVVGERLASGLALKLGEPWSLRVPLAVVDGQHAYARLPPGLRLPEEETQRAVEVTLEGGEGQAPLTVVNDLGFPDLRALAVGLDGRVYALSSTTDELLVLSPDSGEVARVKTLDGPSALAWSGATLLVAHRFSAALLQVSPDGALSQLPAPAYASALAVDGQGIAYVAEHARDTVTAIDLPGGGRTLWRAEVSPNPGALAVAGGSLAVGSLQTGEVQVLDRVTGRLEGTLVPRPGTPIEGGGTARYSAYVMGGKAVRALVWNGRTGRLLSANLGPNIGPNPDRMEVSANGGVSELDLAGGKVIRHRGFGAGVTSALALDDEAGVLYAADPGLGLVRVLDAATLEVRHQIAIPPAPGFPLARPAADFGGKRAGVEVHSGPSALALDRGRRRLWVLNRFTGTVAEIPLGGSEVARQLPLVSTLHQPKRRLGQVLYFADVGRSAMSCDACHLEGHTEGVFFEKTHPMRIYRATTVRGSRETPPYFTPASTDSLSHTASEVGSRNRLHNPALSPPEVEALAQYSAAIVTLPNPFVGEDGAPVEGELQLFDGQRGRPRAGMSTFERQCASCHPAPHFTTDQDPATRGRYLDVGTPEALPLRIQMQDLVGRGMAPPSLLGVWDIFPQLGSGSAGLKVVDGERLEVGARFALRDVLETYGGPRHGDSAALGAQERNDLLAYLLSL
jgi:hypothetical protein